MKHDDLTLYEDIFLLGLKEEDGKVHPKATFLPSILAGGLMMELVLRKAIHIETSGKKLVHVMQNPISGPAMLQECLDIISDTKKKRRLTYWIQRLSQIKDLKERVGMELVEKGVLRAEEGKLLWIFSRVHFPELDPHPERDLIQTLRQALEGDGPVAARTALLIGLTSKSGLLEIPFQKSELKLWKARIEQLSQGNHVGQATKEVIAAAQAAIIIAATMPAITSTTVH